MPNNQHRKLTGEQLHNPKGFDEATASTMLSKNAQGSLEWIDQPVLKTALNYVSPQSAPPTETTGDVYLLDDTGADYTVSSIVAGTNVNVITFSGSPDLSSIVTSDFLTISGSNEAVNSGTFLITAVDNSAKTITVSNIDAETATNETTGATAYYTVGAWDGAIKGEHVAFNGSAWQITSPSDGVLCFDQALGLHRYYSATYGHWDKTLAAPTALNYQGAYDASTNSPNLDSSPSGIQIGDMYTVTVAGTFYTEALEIGDSLIAEVDNPSQLSDWTRIQKNVDGVVTKVGTPANNQIGVWTGDGTLEGDSKLTWSGSTLEISDGTSDLRLTDNFMFLRSDQVDANMYLYTYGGSGDNSQIFMAHANGSINTPTATSLNDVMSDIRFYGHTGTGHREGARIRTVASENFQHDTNHGTAIKFSTAKIGETTITDRYVINGDGSHTFGGAVKINGGNVGIGDDPSTLASLRIKPTGGGGNYGILTDMNINSSSISADYLAHGSNTSTGNHYSFYASNGGITTELGSNVSASFFSTGITTGNQNRSVGLFLQENTAGTKKYGIIQEGDNLNVFEGALEIGTNASGNPLDIKTPTANLEIADAGLGHYPQSVAYGYETNPSGWIAIEIGNDTKWIKAYDRILVS